MGVLVASCLLVVYFSTVCSTNHVYHIQPEGSSSDCPDQQCLTLDEYACQSEAYFVSEAVFVFQPGNHTSRETVNLYSGNLTIRGHEVKVTCNNEVTFQCVGVVNLIMEGITFTFNTTRSLETQRSRSVLKFYNCGQVYLSKLTFLGIREVMGKAIYSLNSSLTLVDCLFKGLQGEKGGAIKAVQQSNLTVCGCMFAGNMGTYGGAIFLNKSSLTLTTSDMTCNVTDDCMNSAGSINSCSPLDIILTEDNFTTTSLGAVVFLNNSAEAGGALLLIDHSDARLTGSNIFFLANSASGEGGAIKATVMSNVSVNSKCLHFIKNRAKFGGAILQTRRGSLNLGADTDSAYYFTENSCSVKGGAIFLDYAILKLTGHGSFRKNTAEMHGGALDLTNSVLTMSGRFLFAHNRGSFGGAISLFLSNATLSGTVIKMMHNLAHQGGGGGISCLNSRLFTKTTRLIFVSNIAVFQGGAVFFMYTKPKTLNSNLRISSAHFRNNRVTTDFSCGGTISVVNEQEAVFENITVTGSTQGSVCLVDSTVVFRGTTIIRNNEGKQGGGISFTNSYLSFEGYTVLEDNRVEFFGGAIAGFYHRISFSGETHITRNRAQFGGALYVAETDIVLGGTVNLISNSAKLGGGLVLSSHSTLMLQPRATVNAFLNHASENGGVIYHHDSTTIYQCDFKKTDFLRRKSLSINIPRCFIDLDPTSSIYSYNNSAGRDGSFLFGGLLDRCNMRDTVTEGIKNPVLPYQLLINRITVQAQEEGKNWLSSKPYELCFCEHDQTLKCSQVTNKTVYPGQALSVSLVALAQGDTNVSTNVTALIGETARLKSDQYLQFINSFCTEAKYTVYSSLKQVELVLYPDGPCRDQGLAKAVINVTLLECPIAFALQDEECACEERLQMYNVNCFISGKVIAREAGAQLWMSMQYVNGSYKGLILGEVCPVNYCTNHTINMTVENLDLQCAHHRSGVLCGACASNYSLTFGSSQCHLCPNSYMALLVLFTVAGIALVAFLIILRLTVASGVVNGIILYANIVQANKMLFFPNTRNVLTGFIAWLNLDLGWQTCFYDGMDAYTQTWLQFVFPAYIWTLICLIILISRYSIVVSRLIGSNPVAVLATLLLMSYAKILKIIIEVYSSAILHYPGNKTVTVWLKDANVPYLQSKHLALTVITSIILVFLFLPYTLLLLLGHKLYRLASKKHFHWLNKIRPLLDAYYAPYKTKTRYWTGLLLLVRCGLYIVFSFNSLGKTRWSLLAIIITFTALIILAWLMVRIYRELYVNIVEASVYLNLIVLSAATATGVNSPALVYTLVGTVYIIAVGTVAQHFYLFYIAKSAVWVRFKVKMTRVVAKYKTKEFADGEPPTTIAATSSHDPHKIVSQTVIELREPLLEN